MTTIRRFPLLNSDCEGPTVLNDNAFELCGHFIQPHGGVFYRVVSRYDDYLGYFSRRPDYSTGDTLRLILPFLKAYGVTNKKASAFSKENLKFTPGARDGFALITHLAWPVFEISTSYKIFALEVARALNISADHVYCTDFDLDAHDIDPGEAAELRSLCEEIAALGDFDLPTTRDEHISDNARRIVTRLDEIFWARLKAMKAATLINSVRPLNGDQKVNAVYDSVLRTGRTLSDVMYIGDSITDVFAFDAVRDGGGITLAFNGNRYAIDHAELACAAPTAHASAVIASIFFSQGRNAVFEAVGDWRIDRLAKYIDQNWLAKYEKQLGVSVIGLTTSDRRPELERESQRYQKELRGGAIADMG
jgi:energy-converting hydrogenase A subunit R